MEVHMMPKHRICRMLPNINPALEEEYFKDPFDVLSSVLIKLSSKFSRARILLLCFVKKTVPVSYFPPFA